MSTICKICIKAAEDDVLAVIRGFLDATHIAYSESRTEWPTASEPDCFITSECSPSILSLKQGVGDAAEIYFNSFGKVRDLASTLSKKLTTGLVVNQYQSAASASYWAYYLNGELLREIEAGDGEVLCHSGVPLAFEDEEPGHDILEQGEKSCIVFDYKDMDYYNSKVGIPMEVYHQPNEDWQNFLLQLSGPAQKPWWQFW